MPRAARKRSASGYYHVVPKGIAGQSLFGEDLDRRYYLGLLAEAVADCGLRLHAYCLMSNHVHLVIEDPDGRISEAMKYVDERYGAYYADKIGRRDGVFRTPYWSEPIEDDDRLLCAVRYVHANPAVAGICPASAYPWSSVGDYLGRTDPERGGPAVPGLATTEVVLDLLGGRKGFIEWSRAKNSTARPFKDSALRGHLIDDEAITLATAILGHDPRNGTTAREARLLVERGFEMKRVQRMTGVSRYLIQHAEPFSLRG